jgi:RNA polymerase sigma-70 factor, ECF subfamily
MTFSKDPPAGEHPWVVTTLPVALAFRRTRPAPDLATVHADHVDFVWRSLQRLGVREPDLEDALQEVFVVVHRRLSSFDGSCRMTSWLFGIALRVAAAHRRRAHRRREQLVAEVGDDRASPEQSPEEQTALRQARERVTTILDSMDLEKRVVFVMFELEELGGPEIALELGIPVGTVYSRLDAARRDFARALKRLELRERTGGKP